MLKSIRLKNFAIFRDAAIPFSEGLCIISGETGAGKSIMVDGMLALLGSKVDSTVVREASGEVAVEGLFEIEGSEPINRFLASHGFEPSSELAVKRIINVQGKSRVYINGSPSTLSMLSELSKLLVDIHGQHEHQSLLDESTHIKLLDAYAGLEKSAQHIREMYMELIKTINECDKQQARIAGVKQEEELIVFQLSEISAAALKPGEDVKLEKEYVILSNAQRLTAEMGIIYETIYGSEHIGNQQGAISDILRALKIMTGLQDIDPSIKQYADRLESVSVELKDIAAEINSYLSKIDLDAQRLEQTEQRIGLIDGLKKKYGGTIEKILEHARTAEKHLNELNSAGDELDKLRRRRSELERQLYKEAKKLSEARKRSAEELGKKIVRELKVLGIKGAVFEIRIDDIDRKDSVMLNNRRINADGADKVRFYFSANPGFQPKPLTEIISGGELSRTMLAIKKVLVNVSPVPVLVFDEIDTGIGGHTAEIVGRKLRELAEYHQVICITHLHQIASFGSYHINVSKHTSAGKTEVAIKILNEKERIEEIARMLSGEVVTELARKQAGEFLRYAKETK